MTALLQPDHLGVFLRLIPLFEWAHLISSFASQFFSVDCCLLYALSPSLSWSSPIHFGPFPSPGALFQLSLMSSFSLSIPHLSAFTFMEVNQRNSSSPTSNILSIKLTQKDHGFQRLHKILFSEAFCGFCTIFSLRRSKRKQQKIGMQQ